MTGGPARSKDGDSHRDHHVRDFGHRLLVCVDASAHDQAAAKCLIVSFNGSVGLPGLLRC